MHDWGVSLADGRRWSNITSRGYNTGGEFAPTKPETISQITWWEAPLAPYTGPATGSPILAKYRVYKVYTKVCTLVSVGPSTDIIALLIRGTAASLSYVLVATVDSFDRIKSTLPLLISTPRTTTVHRPILILPDYTWRYAKSYALVPLNLNKRNKIDSPRFRRESRAWAQKTPQSIIILHSTDARDN